MKKPVTLIGVALLCVSCAPAGNTTTAPSASAAASTTSSAPVSLSANSGPQAPGGTIPATIGITWDQASKDEAMGGRWRGGHRVSTMSSACGSLAE